MSNEAITWALAQHVKPSSAKFVLVVMANCSDKGTWICWPSVAHLAEATQQDRKTVLEGIKRLKAAGLISETAQRKGVTHQVIVYALNSTENGTVPPSEQAQKRDDSAVETVTKTAPLDAETVPKAALLNDPENGTVPEIGKAHV